jgi:hypothetical protein
MALGKFSDTNLALAATLQGTVSPILPLANMQDEQRYVTRPARFASVDLARSQFEVVMPDVSLVSLVGLLFHSMTLEARYRLTIADLGDTTYSAPLLQTDWEYVFPSIYDPVDLLWGAENFWAGTLTEAEIDLVPRHLWIPFDEVLASRIRVELNDHTNPAGYFDVGGLQVISGWSPLINFDRGRELAVLSRDLLDEGPSGRIFGEERTPRRQLTLNYSNLEDGEALRFVDAALRARTTRTVVFLPNTDDPAGLMREGFPANLASLPGAKFGYPGANASALVLKEILA